MAQKIRLNNQTNDEMQLWLEPLGDMVRWPPHTALDLIGSGEFEGVAQEVRLAPGRITVYGWVDQILLIKEDASPVPIWPPPPASARK
ncbi:MAG: hypothetical protein V4510_02180 [bacterium]